MIVASHSSPIFRWHHRVLGVIWMLSGLLVAGKTVLHASWNEYQQWIALFIATAYVAAGIGFTLGHRWGRRTMGVLMVVAMLWFLDIMLMTIWVHDVRAFWAVMAGFLIAGYTLSFLAISATDP